MNKENKMYDYLLNHSYISKNKKSNYQDELSIERAECIANKFNSLVKEKNTNLKQVLIDIRKYCKDNNVYWGNDSYINGKNEGVKEVKQDILQIIDKVLGDGK